jgi:hypothetical protein
VGAKAGRRHEFALALRHDGLSIFANRILPTEYLPTGYLPIGAATVGGASLRGKSAAAETLSTVKNPTVLNKAINPAVLNTARNAVVSSITIFITLIPLFSEALGQATEGRPYSPPAGFHRLNIFDPSHSATSRAIRFLTKG